MLNRCVARPIFSLRPSPENVLSKGCLARDDARDEMIGVLVGKRCGEAKEGLPLLEAR